MGWPFPPNDNSFVYHLSIYHHHLWFFTSYFLISDPVYFHWKADMPRYDWSLIQWPGFCQTLSLLSTSGTGNISHWNAIEKCPEMHTDRIITEADISQWKNALARLRHRGNILPVKGWPVTNTYPMKKGAHFDSSFSYAALSPIGHWVLLSFLTSQYLSKSFLSFHSYHTLILVKVFWPCFWSITTAFQLVYLLHIFSL